MQIKEFRVDRLKVKIFASRQEMGEIAAGALARHINNFLQQKNEITIVFASAPSQNEFLAGFIKQDVPWDKINAFHMDEYVGIDPVAPQGFGQYLRERLFDKRVFKSVHIINPDEANAQQECERYSTLLHNNPPDIVCLGIGENGHLAFNDPPVADFNDPRMVKIVELDNICRQQQVNDGCFATFDDVPRRAITLTIPALLSAPFLSCVVPGKTKAAAVKKTFENEISTECPATILRQHQNTSLYLDVSSSSQLNAQKLS